MGMADAGVLSYTSIGFLPISKIHFLCKKTKQNKTNQKPNQNYNDVIIQCFSYDL